LGKKRKKIAIFPLLFFHFFSILKKFGARRVVNILLGSAGGLFQKIWRRFFRFINYCRNIS